MARQQTRAAPTVRPKCDLSPVVTPKWGHRVRVTTLGLGGETEAGGWEPNPRIQLVAPGPLSHPKVFLGGFGGRFGEVPPPYPWHR